MRKPSIELGAVSVCAVLLLLTPAFVYAQEPNTASTTEKTLGDATDEELVAVMSGTHVDEAIQTVQERINRYPDDGGIDEIERLIPSFLTAEGDRYVWEVKESILKRARECAQEGRHEEAELHLHGLPAFLSSAAGNAVSEARAILSERARRYAKAGQDEEMERLMRLLAPVIQDTSLDELRRLHLLEVLCVPAQYESTADAAFDFLCRLLVDDPSAEVRYRAVAMLQEPRRADAIPFFKAAALDDRNVAKGGPGGSVRQAAIEALGWCGGPDAAIALLELRRDDTLEPEEKDAVIMALGRTGSAEAALPEMLKIIETGDVSEMCSATLGLGSGFHRYPPDAQSTIMDVFRAGLHHPNDSRRRATCTAMKYTGDFYLIPLIEPLLDDPLVRARAESAIRGLQFQMAQYRQMMGIPDEERDMAIGEVLQNGWAYSAMLLRWRLADDPARQEIICQLAESAVASSDRDVKFNAVSVLEKFEERRDDAVRAVLQVLASAQDPLTSDYCYKALGGLGGPDAIRALKEAILAGLREGTAFRSLEAELYPNLFMYLGGCGPEAAPVLFEIARTLNRENDPTLWAALAATHNDEMVMPFLLEKARTASEFSRSRALHSACLMAYAACPPETRQQIAEMLVQDAGSEHSTVREVVAWGLGVVGDSSHIPLLERMAAEDPHSSRRIGSRGDEKIDEIVYPIREAAAKSIENIRQRLHREQEPAAQ
jgi:HEAT repeat protein